MKNKLILILLILIQFILLYKYNINYKCKIYENFNNCVIKKCSNGFTYDNNKNICVSNVNVTPTDNVTPTVNLDNIDLSSTIN